MVLLKIQCKKDQKSEISYQRSNHHFVLIKKIDKFLSKTYDTGKHRKYYENAFF